LAGHAAEDLIFNERTTGPHSDIKRATDYARKMVIDFGMSDKLGPRTFGNKQELVFLGREISEQRDYSERFALEIDKEVNILISEGYSKAKGILTKNKKKLIRVAEKLVIQETLESEELESLLGESAPSTPTESTVKPALKTATDKVKTKPVVKEA
jgi:cell division protease FtsH